MDARVGLVFLFMLCGSWVCEARQMSSESTVMQINEEDKMDIKPLEEVSRNENVCTLCEEFASQALVYISENKTQTEIIETLHMTCAKVPSFKKQCITLVDYYAPLFFLEVSSVEPEDFCRKVNLCEKTAITELLLDTAQDSCGACHSAVSEILIKLKDPDTQLEILELLLKACNSADKYVKKCKKMVFEYGPVILVNAGQFLETTDVCTIIHACNTNSSEQASQVVEASGHSDS